MGRAIGKSSKVFYPAVQAALYAALFMTFAAVLAPRAMAQAVAVADVDGYVTDPSGLPVPGAQVTMTETGKHKVRSTQVDSGGRFSFPNLDIGSYDLTVSAKGFKVNVQSGIVLEVARNISINVHLQLGAVTQTVEVKSSTTMLETKDNSITSTIDPMQVADLPLNGRNSIQLLTLTPAAATTGETFASMSDLITTKNIAGSAASQTFSVAGGQANGSNWLLDGGDNNDPLFNVNLPLPFPDALQEFSVQTTALPAQYGLHPAGVINAITKSGSNSFHGDLFEYFRNGYFDAIQSGSTQRDSLKRSQFGGVIGGKLIRDKLFFFAGYQGTRQRSSPPVQINYVPTAAVLAGDFSTLEEPASQGGCLSQSTTRQLINPATGAPFAGNFISPTLFSAPSLAIATMYLPAPINACGEALFGFPANNPDNLVIGRMDYIQSSRNSMFGRYLQYGFLVQSVFNGTNLLTTQQTGQKGRTVDFTFGDTYSINPTTLNAFHATFARRRDDRGGADNIPNPQSIGVNTYAPVPNLLDVIVANYFSVGCGVCAPGFFNTNTFQVSEDVFLTRGRHEIAFGADVRRVQANLLTNHYTNGEFDFAGGFTGDALADFLLGDMQYIEQGNPQPDALRETEFAMYVQDTFRASRRLTLNLGLRWEPEEFPYDRYGRAPAFSQANFNAGIVSEKYPTAPAGVIFPGDPGSGPGSSQVDSYWKQFSPRVGFIFDPRGEGMETIRGGFALMYDNGFMYYPQQWTGSPPFASDTTITTPTSNFAAPWAGQPGGDPFPSTGSFPLASTYTVMPKQMPPTYMMQRNLTLQKQIGKSWMFQIGYLGSSTVHIWSGFDENPSVYIPGSTAPANQRRLLYLENPSIGKYYSSVEIADPGGNGNYNALLVTVQHRFASHFQITSNYTHSHCISDEDTEGEAGYDYLENPFNRKMDYGNCANNRYSLFNFSAVVTSPAVASGVVRRVIRNWDLAPLVEWQGGDPLNITDGGLDISGNDQGLDRPNQVLSAVYPAHKTRLEWFNPAAFAEQAPGTFGNVRRDYLTGPHSFDLDAALSRTFQVRESLGLMVRAEAFNALNHPIWQDPQTAITSAQFGEVTTYGPPRIMEFALKLIF